MTRQTSWGVVLVVTGALAFRLEGHGAPQPSALPAKAAGTEFGQSRHDQLSGKWLVCEGRAKDDGFYFDGTLSNTCGEADFRPFVNKVKLQPTRLPGSAAVLWGEYLYRLGEDGILTLTQPDGTSIKCFVKYEQKRPTMVGLGTTHIPHIFVFYEPRGRRAFGLLRKSEEITKWAAGAKSPEAQAVFVPHQDRLTGSWAILPNQPTGVGQLEFRLDGPPPEDAARLNVFVSNLAEIKGGGSVIRFRLRQYGPSQWAIESLPDSACSTGTIALDEGVGKIAGPSILISRWQIGSKRMTAVLKSEGYPRPPNVPAIRFDAAMPLDFEALRAAGQPGPTTGTLGLGPR